MFSTKSIPLITQIVTKKISSKIYVLQMRHTFNNPMNFMKRQILSAPLQHKKLISSFKIQRRKYANAFWGNSSGCCIATAWNNNDDVDQNNDTSVFLGEGNFQILNFAYALE